MFKKHLHGLRVSSTWSKTHFSKTVNMVRRGHMCTSDCDKVNEASGRAKGKMQRHGGEDGEIIEVPEQPGSSTPAAVTKLLKDVLKMDKKLRALTPKSDPNKPRDKPRAIIAKLHNDGDTTDILRRACNGRGNNRSPIAILLNNATNVAKARTTFTNIRKMLRGRPEVRFGILFPARLRMSHGNNGKVFTDLQRNS